MLTEHPKFQGTLVGAHKEPTFRRTDENGQLQFEQQGRHHFVVDDNNLVIATVSDLYRVVQNTDFLCAVDIAADNLGIKIEPTEAAYSSGNSRYKLRTPDMHFQPKGDSSGVEGSIILGNDYRGSGGLQIKSGWFRLICKNGLTIGTIASYSTQRHVGDFDVYQFVFKALEKFLDRWEIERVLADTLTDRPYIFTNMAGIETQLEAQNLLKQYRDNGVEADIFVQMAADTPNRYQKDLQNALISNLRHIGQNMWAVSQAVSEMATHRLQQRSDGGPRTGYNFAADQWATRQLNKILAEAGIE